MLTGKTVTLRFMATLMLGALAGVSSAQDAEQEEDIAAAVAEIEPAVDVSDTPRLVRDEAPVRQAQRGSPGVMDRLDLGTTSITGNQELPKVLYIVPWKRSDLGNLVGRPVNTLLDEVLAPVDPEVFERHLDYYDTLYGDSEQE